MITVVVGPAEGVTAVGPGTMDEITARLSTPLPVEDRDDVDEDEVVDELLPEEPSPPTAVILIHYVR